jgi:8-oxo-dGTP diphosphatase
MIHRNGSGSSERDFHQDKWNGLGGKLEADESPVEAARRECFEESGIDLPLTEFRSLGVLQFPLFKPHKNEDWIVFVFVARLPSVRAFESEGRVISEGTLHWVHVDQVMDLNLWPGDRLFIPYVVNSKSFLGSIWYQNLSVVRHWISEQ